MFVFVNKKYDPICCCILHTYKYKLQLSSNFVFWVVNKQTKQETKLRMNLTPHTSVFHQFPLEAMIVPGRNFKNWLLINYLINFIQKTVFQVSIQCLSLCTMSTTISSFSALPQQFRLCNSMVFVDSRVSKYMSPQINY